RQAAALRDLWLAWRAWRHPQEAAAESAEGGAATERDAPGVALRPLLLLALPALLAALAAAAAHRRRARPVRAVPVSYRRAPARGRGRGARRHESDPARSFAARVASTLGSAPAHAFAEVTELYLAERFGRRAADAAGAAALRRLRDSLRA